MANPAGHQLPDSLLNDIFKCINMPSKFKQIAQTNLRKSLREFMEGQKWFLAKVSVCQEMPNIVRITGLLPPLSIPSIPPIPENLVRVRSVRFECLSDNVLTLLQHFRLLFSTSPINLYIEATKNKVLRDFAQKIWPSIRDRIFALILPDGLKRIRHFLPTFLVNRCPSNYVVSIGAAFPDFSADGSTSASADGFVLAQWLLSSDRECPKVLKYDAKKVDAAKIYTKILRLVEAFLESEVCSNFIISIYHFASNEELAPYRFDNHSTGERLSFSMELHVKGARILIVRSPIKRNEQKWAHYEAEAKNWHFDHQWNLCSFYLSDVMDDESDDEEDGDEEEEENDELEEEEEGGDESEGSDMDIDEMPEGMEM
ncbi:hypothetical protein niasHS_006333 [Heterodera schachtii]|uniref:F-box domain-containing protein n=1 Tax=Heterodera schachtii TaxID=97005 RepID=A0ABD2JWG6_HETSC